MKSNAPSSRSTAAVDKTAADHERHKERKKAALYCALRRMKNVVDGDVDFKDEALAVDGVSA